MSQPTVRAMRDAVIEGITAAMHQRDDVFFLTGDFGAPTLDKLRADFPDRFINMGIAEQNLINVATGLALEGFTVYAYAIAPFITMRCYEQIRVNLAILSQVRDLNVNLIGVGAGFSYVVSGPTHHCLEDLAVMNVLPNVEVISPADWMTAKSFVDYSLNHRGPKYFRFDARPVPAIYDESQNLDIKDGFQVIKKGSGVGLVSTGIMTHKALEIVKHFEDKGIEVGLIDLYNLSSYNRDSLKNELRSYQSVMSIEEGFIGKGGLDSIIGGIIHDMGHHIMFSAAGLQDKYLFHIGSREYLHEESGVGKESLIKRIEAMNEKVK